jgi:quercetin dioxygenase-like cupin family protein
MFIKKITCLFLLLLIAKLSSSQIPVREEPRHHVALQNQYLRLLDVHLQPGDTTFFHVHEIPSLFLVLSKTLTASQVKGQQWVNGTFTSDPGYTWYNAFTSGPLIHRVANIDTTPFHVMDIEILSNYNSHLAPLPFDTIYTNEKAFAYRVNLANKEEKKQIADRGPIAAIVVSGPGIAVHFTDNKTENISQGKFIFLEPKTNCWFQNNGDDSTKVVLFELR